jgi:CO/xanthine dehydrogenase Mo-binding subunit
MADHLIGARVGRKEDLRLVAGEGAFLDDIHVAGCLEAVFVRSDFPHASIGRIDTTEALHVPGVVAALTHADLGELDRPLPLGMLGPGLHHPRMYPPLAGRRVRMVGEPVVAVIATTREIAEDAAARVIVDYEPLPAVASIEDALVAESLVHEDVPDNIAATMHFTIGDPEGAFGGAPHIVKRTLRVERSAGMPLETRGVLAQFDGQHNRLTVYDSTQSPTTVRLGLAAVLGLDQHNVEVIAPDVGGGFGAKLPYWYPEEFIVPYAAISLGRPVKWVEDRGEHFVASNHERGQVHDARIVVADDGTILGLEDTWVHDAGAYTPYGVTVPLVTAKSMTGPYRVPYFRSDCRVVYTNTRPVTPYRGTGHPQGCFVMERMLDAAAQQLNISRVEIRQRNLIRPEEFPYATGWTHEDGSPASYDVGDPPRLLEEALRLVRAADVEEDRADAARRGCQVGLGVAMYMERTGAQLYEGARVHIEPTGKVLVATGVGSQGQGHETIFAQIAAETLGCSYDDVAVVVGNTRHFEWGIGTYASRVATIAGNAVAGAARKVREKLELLAAEALEASREDLVVEDGVVRVAGVADRVVTFRELAHLATPVRVAYDEQSLAASQFADRTIPTLDILSEPGLQATEFCDGLHPSSASGCHAAVVEIDADTFQMRILRYAIAFDSGRLINPMIVEGQIVGGAAQGIAGACYERIHYDDSGQLLNANFMDFLMPYATEIPEMVVEHFGTLSRSNPLGIKGCGEVGVIPTSALIVSAIEEALGIPISEAPLTPDRLFALSRSHGADGAIETAGGPHQAG